MPDIFVGFYFDSEKEKELRGYCKHSLSIAANQYQEGFLSGLTQEVAIVTAMPFGLYPIDNKKLVVQRENRECRWGKICYLPFVNIYGIREKMLAHSLCGELRRVLKKQERTTVYVYSLYLPFLTAMKRIKRRFGNKVHYCLIVPDLPGKYGLIRRGVRGIKDRMEADKKMALANAADSFVFLTEPMKERFDEKPYTVIEGFLPLCEFVYSNVRAPKTVLYTGSLDEAFGIGKLLEAFSMIQDEDAQLWICGAGNMENVVKKASEKDPRIQFKGFLPKNEIAILQTKCDVLINPRTDEGEYTKYSFPSKTMEYLLSGSKVVMYRLAGIGDEYYRYIRIIDEETPESIVKSLVCAWDDLAFYESDWREQVEWIQRSKNAKSQLEKIVKQ